MKGAFPTGTDTGGKPVTFVPPKIEELAAKFPQLEILEFIGQGGMGAVYKARQKQLDRIVALKILPPQAASGPGFAERFAREARALAKLNHPHIVTLYEFGQADGLFYFLMEFVDGTNLRRVLNAGRIAPKEALAIVPQICEALQFAHENGIVHRDIKPENILLSKTGQVKIADFGVAKIVAEGLTEAAGTVAAPAGELTEAGSTLGTPQYMAPEQIKNSAEVDHRADIYSLGVVFYQMLTGELPQGKIEPPSKKVHIDVRLDEVVLRALEKKPELRFQDANVLRTQVETIAQTTEAVAGSVEAFVQAAQARDYSLNITSCLERGWRLVISDFWPIVGVSALVWLLAKVASSSIVGLIIGAPLAGGLWLYYLNRIRGRAATLETAFSGFKVAFLQLVLVGLIVVVLRTLGFICLILPGIYLWVAWAFAVPLVADKGLEFWPAMGLSHKVISRHWWKFFWFMLVLTVIHIIGVACCYVGLFVAMPLCMAAMAYAYEDILGPVAGGSVTAPAGAPARSSGAGVSLATALGIAGGMALLVILGVLAIIGLTRPRLRYVALEPIVQPRANVEATVRIRRFTVFSANSPTVVYAATIPSGYDLQGAATSGYVRGMQSSPDGIEIFWTFPMVHLEKPQRSEPGQPWKPSLPPKIDSPDQLRAQKAAMQVQLQELQDQGPITVVFGEPKRLFSVTNGSGDVYEGFLELVVKGTNKSLGSATFQGAPVMPASVSNRVPAPNPEEQELLIEAQRMKAAQPASIPPPPLAPPNVIRPLRTLPHRIPPLTNGFGAGSPETNAVPAIDGGTNLEGATNGSNPR